MFERLAVSARDAITHSAKEAGRRGDRRIGTDHLLLGLLHDPEIAELLGVDLDAARATSLAADRTALAAIGIDVGDFGPTAPISSSKHAPFTSGARAVIPRALALAVADKVRRITPRHLLLALLERNDPDPAAAMLTDLQIDRSDVRDRATRR